MSTNDKLINKEDKNNAYPSAPKDVVSQNGFVRVDKNMLSMSFLKEMEQFGEQKNLCRDIAIWICEGYEKDLFNFGLADPYVLAKSMGYKSVSNLFEKVDKPYQFDFENLSEADIEELRKTNSTFETRWEDAFYRLNTTPFLFKFREEIKGEVKLVQSSLLFLPRISLTVDKKNKKYIRFQTSDKLINNLSLFYSMVYKPAMISLRKPGLVNLYFYLLELKDTVKLNGSSVGEPALDLLLKLSGSKIKDFTNQKFYLNNSFKSINAADEMLKANLEWSKNGKFFSKPKIIFTYLKFANEPADRKARYLGYVYIREVIRIFKAKYISEDDLFFDEHLFINWINSNTKDIDLKIACFEEVHKVVFGKPVRDQWEARKFIEDYRFMI
jgi:hypothetical protein